MISLKDGLKLSCGGSSDNESLHALDLPTSLPSILLVDDEPDCRALAKTMLKGLGNFEYFEACSATEAKSLLRHKTFNLVISDLFMQFDTGIDVLIFLLEQSHQRPTPFMILTSSVGVLPPEFRDRICVLDKANMTSFSKKLKELKFL